MKSIPKQNIRRPDWQRKNWLNLNGEWAFGFSGSEQCPSWTAPLLVLFPGRLPLPSGGGSQGYRLVPPHGAL